MSPVPRDERSDDGIRGALDRYMASASSGAAERLVRELEAHEADAADPLGATIGEFEVVARIGAGGMGEVFAAKQASVPGRTVALKVLPGLATAGVRRERFAREVAVIGRLDHPNIVPILTADLDASTPYFAMKLIDGETAARAVVDARRRRRSA